MKELQQLYDNYKNQYDFLKLKIESIDDVVETWSKGSIIDFFLYESEKLGYKKGKQLKKEPLNKDGVFVYKHHHNNLVYSAYYIGNYVAYEVFYFYEYNKSIAVTFGNDRMKVILTKVDVIYLENDLQIKNLRYYRNNDRETYSESDIMYNEEIINIKERGFMYIGDNKVEINQDFQVVKKQGEEPVINNTVNNLASGLIKTYQIYPKNK